MNKNTYVDEGYQLADEIAKERYLKKHQGCNFVLKLILQNNHLDN